MSKITMTTNTDSETSVQVALRVRPQNAKEQIDMCQICTFCTPDQPQIVLGQDKAFTYDYVFDTDSQQMNIYSGCVENLVDGCFEGYNATIFAYGQTGSGKTYTMGTGFGMSIKPDEQGLIPRAVNHIFTTIEGRREEALGRGEPPPQFEVTTEFLELYNEDLIDLFDCNRDTAKKLKIHEDPNGGIYIAGVTTQKVESEEETLSCLKQGALSRTVGSTNMNAQSSRSHAIFTIQISQQRPLKTPVGDNSNESGGSDEGGGGEGGGGGEEGRYEITDWESLSAKFHFVDLAGSERLKRTGATGERAKEGISINCGLLALGNVISALGDKTKKGSHVPYRDSKLTRLLQDSLGGNSRTLMIACVSPTDRDFMETLNTLKYANRARNIKNKVVVNQDKASQQLATLRTRIQALELELQEFRSGRMVVNEEGSVVMNDLASEVTMLRTENDKLRIRVKSLQQVIDSQSERIAAMAAQSELAALGHQDESTGQVVGQESEGSHLPMVIKGYMKQIEELQSRLVLSETMSRHNPSSPYRRPPSLIMQGRQATVSSIPFEQETSDLLQTVRSDITKLRERKERKMSESEHKHTRRLHSTHDLPTHSALSVVSEDDNTLEGVAGGKERDVFGSDEESNSSNEDFSDEELTLHGSDSSEDSEEELDDSASLASSVADLSSEINIKEQLVEQLEKAQKNIHVMKQQYEDKMTLLQTQIRSVEAERDKVLKDMTGTQRGSVFQPGMSFKDVKTRYEKQLVDMRTELKSLKMAKKEHSKAMKKNAQNENELRRLKSDLLEMKKQRVKMLNQMRQEASRKKQDEARVVRQIAQLKKEDRKKENRIQSLEAEAQRRDNVLKRRADELSLLRRQNRMQHSHSNSSLTSSLSSSTSSTHLTAGGGVGASSSAEPPVVLREKHSVRALANRFERNSHRKSSIFSSNSAKRKWKEFEKKVNDAIMSRLTTSTLSRDMDRWIEKRDRLSRRADELRRQKDSLMRDNRTDVEELQSVEEDIDSLLANVEYVQNNIVELQNDLIAIDDSKNDSDTLEAHAIISGCGPRDAKYLLEHLLDMVLSLGVKAEQKEMESRSLVARLKTSEDNAEMLKSFSSPQVSFGLAIGQTVTKRRMAHSRPPKPIPFDLGAEERGQGDGERGGRGGGGGGKGGGGKGGGGGGGGGGKGGKGQNGKTDPEEPLSVSTKARKRTLLPSEILSKLPTRPRSEPVLLALDDLDHTDSEGSGSSLRTRRGSGTEAKKKPLKKRMGTAPNLDAPRVSTSSSNLAPPSPNQSLARQLGSRPERSEGNVWSRLASSGATATPSDTDNRGLLQAERSKVTSRLLTCTHTASGHSAGVLSVFATQNLLFSGSQDRTVKIWDLKSGQEVLTLDKHFSYVRCVRYCTRSRLIFTASQSLIKIWDHRNFRGKCIKTFGPPHSSSHPGGETVVQDLLLSSASNTLFSAAGNFVHIWDLRKFMTHGRLVGHSGAVCALTQASSVIATGSRDRLIKLYDMDSLLTPPDSSPPHAAASHYPTCTLYPPHYDAISSFAVHRDSLFSACGCTFKLWDTKDRCLKQAVDGAHSQGTTITSLCVLPSPSPLLVSGCKGGLLKLWNPDTCANIGEVSAHRTAVNSIATNDTCIFTGSSDKTIRVWKPAPQQEI